MAFIEPSTYIYFCSGVPLDNRYANTLWFEDRAQQQLYFTQRVVTQMTGCTYQRQQATIRASVPMSTLTNCNYLYFYNENFERRYFYCFINDVRYINNEVTEVQFQIDIVQTYFLDCTLRQCFIERAHTANDEIGNNLVPEGLETGEYVVKEMSHTTALDAMVICVACTVDENGNAVSGGYYSRVYSGVKIFSFDTAAEVDQFLTKLTELNKADAVVNIFMMPHTFQVAAGTVPKENDFNVSKPYDSISGYVPQNKKLFTYPYNVLTITNGEGIAANYRYEFFAENPARFIVYGSMCSTPQAVCVPTKYKGSQAQAWDEKIVLDGWAQCAWNIDTYKAWLAQNANLIDWQDNTNAMALRNADYQAGKATDTTMLNVIGSALTAGAAGAALGSAAPVIGTAAGAGIGALVGFGKAAYQAYSQPAENTMAIQQVQNQIEGVMAQRQDHSTVPPQAVGGGSSTVMQGLGLKSYFIFKKQITAEFAKIIDDYFSMFGYAQHKVAIPNVHARSRFTYIKTKGSCLYGNAPVWAISSLNKILDNGITFWADYVGVGNYTFPNPALGGGEY